MKRTLLTLLLGLAPAALPATAMAHDRGRDDCRWSERYDRSCYTGRYDSCYTGPVYRYDCAPYVYNCPRYVPDDCYRGHDDFRFRGGEYHRH